MQYWTNYVFSYNKNKSMQYRANMYSFYNLLTDQYNSGQIDIYSTLYKHINAKLDKSEIYSTLYKHIFVTLVKCSQF